MREHVTPFQWYTMIILTNGMWQRLLWSPRHNYWWILTDYWSVPRFGHAAALGSWPKQIFNWKKTWKKIEGGQLLDKNRSRWWLPACFNKRGKWCPLKLCKKPIGLWRMYMQKGTDKYVETTHVIQQKKIGPRNRKMMLQSNLTERGPI